MFAESIRGSCRRKSVDTAFALPGVCSERCTPSRMEGRRFDEFANLSRTAPCVVRFESKIASQVRQLMQAGRSLAWGHDGASEATQLTGRTFRARSVETAAAAAAAPV